MTPYLYVHICTQVHIHVRPLLWFIFRTPNMQHDWHCYLLNLMSIFTSITLFIRKLVLSLEKFSYWTLMTHYSNVGKKYIITKVQMALDNREKQQIRRTDFKRSKNNPHCKRVSLFFYILPTAITIFTLGTFCTKNRKCHRKVESSLHNVYITLNVKLKYCYC